MYALAHRDYLVNGSEVHIDIYDDRMEIYSPGGMTDGSIIQDRDPLTVPSTRRNPVLADIFNRLGYMGRKGSGFGKIIGSYEFQINYSPSLGWKVILYFYPKDNTAGCTKQACGFSERYPQFTEKGAVILGVSKDSVSSHKRFEEKYGLAFTLLADPERKVIEAYDVWKEKKNYGKVSMGVVRTTYLIDEQGIIIKANDKVKAADDPENMLKELD